MKNLLQTFLLSLIAVVFVGCASSGPGLQVGADKRTDAGISDFKTFNWVSDVAEIPNDQLLIGQDGILVFNNKSTRKSIKDAIQTQLQAKGFSRDSNNPDMLVNFTVLEQDDQLRTYTRDGYNYLGDGPVDRDAKMVDVEAGTILLNFVNAESGNVVWQGFASSALEETDVKNEATLKSKVNAIFDRFDFNAFSLS